MNSVWIAAYLFSDNFSMRIMLCCAPLGGGISPTASLVAEWAFLCKHSKLLLLVSACCRNIKGCKYPILFLLVKKIHQFYLQINDIQR